MQAYDKAELSTEPAVLAGELVQYMVNVVRYTLESTIGLLKSIKLPDVTHLSPSEAVQRVNQVIATVCNYAQLQVLSKSLTKYLSELSLTSPLNNLISKVLSFLINQINNVANRFQSFIPMLLMKLYFPTGLMKATALPILNSSLKEEEVTLLKTYIQELVATIEKEREQHYQDVNKLATLEQQGVSSIENVRRVKREFEGSVQNLLVRIEEEAEKHQQEVRQLKNELEMERASAKAKISQMTEEFEKQKRGLALANDALATYEIEELKREKVKQSETIEMLRLEVITEKAATEERIAELHKDFARQKQGILEKIESMRGDWSQRIQELKSSSDSKQENENEPLTGENQEVSEQTPIQNQETMSQEDNSSPDIKIEELLRDFAIQKDELEKERDLIKQQLQESTDTHKEDLERERTQYTEQILNLQNTITLLKKKSKSSKLFGSINKALLTAKPIDKPSIVEEAPVEKVVKVTTDI